MNQQFNRNVALCTIMTCLALGCSGTQEEPEVQVPTALGEVDPLIEQLVLQVAAQVEADSTNGEIWGRYASVLMANTFYEESVLASKQALILGSENSLQLQYRQSATLWRLNRQEEAIADLTSVLEIEPRYDFGWRTLASWYVERGDLDAAMEAINRAWEIAPNRPGTLETLVRILLQQDQAGIAISRLAPRLNKNDTPPHLYFLAAQAYRRLGETESMESATAKGGPLPALWPDPWLNEIALLATGKRKLAANALAMLRKQGPANALPVLESAFNADPANSQIRGAFALALMAVKQEARSLQVIEGIGDSEDAEPDYWMAFANIAIEKAKGGDLAIWLPRAMAYFQKTEALTGGSPRLYRSMARLAKTMDKPEQASEYYRKGAEILISAGNIQHAKILLGEGISANMEDETLRTMLEDLMKTQ